MKKSKYSAPLPDGACVLCRSSADDKDRLGEIRTLEGVAIHYFCALFASGLCQNGDRDTEGIWGFLLPDIKQEAKRARHLTCAFCKRDGASVGCSLASCRVAFHFPCGLDNGVLNQFYDSFRSYCERHRLQQEVRKRKRRPVESSLSKDTCAICLCDVDPRPSIDVLIAPCCHNSYLHRECVKRQALSSGLHFFKCPLCNNKDLFTDEMLKFGIYIPDQDASWEQEDNAFGELLERHCCCDVDKCLCEYGRNYNNADSCWEIMLCESCGSQGTHLFCSKLNTAFDDWMCDPCRSVSIRVSRQKEEKNGRKRKNKTEPGSASALTHGLATEPWASCSSGMVAQSGGTDAADVTPRLQPTSVLMDLTSVVSNTSPSGPASKPRPRCLSRYIQRHKTVRLPLMEDRPRWVRNLLNDDIHTGRNLGAKLSFMHTDES